MTRLNDLLLRAWRIDRPLTATTLAMLALFVAFVVGMAVDPRVIAGAPAWLKPAKFAISIAIFSATMIGIFSMLAEWPRLRRRVSVISTVVFFLEMGIIALQAWRGTTSHFNVATPLDGILFAVMGTGIIVQTVTTIAVAVALWRQPFADRAFGWALRLGIAISIVGSFTGALMTRPTSAQLTEARATHRMTVSGAHTVGAPDGGPGLPGTGWSTTHGDLRVPHFVGLHALQVLPLLWAVLPATLRTSTRTRIVVAGAVSYSTLFAWLLWQALAGESLFHPSPLGLAIAAIWAAASIAAFAAAWLGVGTPERFRVRVASAFRRTSQAG